MNKTTENNRILYSHILNLKSIINPERVKIEMGNMVFFTVKLQPHTVFTLQNMTLVEYYYFYYYTHFVSKCFPILRIVIF